MSRAGLLSEIFVYYIMIIIFGLLGLIWYTKYIYTRNTRDKRYWNRVTFSEDNVKPSTLSPTVLNSIATATTATCSSTSMSESQGLRFNRASGSRRTHRSRTASGSESTINSLSDVVAWCGNNISINDPITDLPCKKVWCYGNPNLSVLDPLSNKLSECKVLFPEVATRDMLSVVARLFESVSAEESDTVSASAPASNSLSDIVAWCGNNISMYDPMSGLPCKKVWCYGNPNLSIIDPLSNTLSECKVLFPEVATGNMLSAVSSRIESRSVSAYVSNRAPSFWE